MADISNLGKYEVRREIGRGAMGVVYEGYDPMIKRIVALKTIRADQLAGDESATVIARFRREAQAAGRLSHPNIVPIYDFGEDNGVWFIAMEFVKGRELKEYFEANERFSVADIVRIMTQVLDALEYSHRQGVIHRDIKPANIFLVADGAVKVADFGIAHIESSSLTQVGTVLGTPSYMSPEQIMGLPVDGRSDLFSAGVILYQFLTGERPFAGSATTTMQKVLKEDPLPPSTLNVQILPEMDAVMRKALAKRPDERFQSAREFSAAIRSAAQVGTGSFTAASAGASGAEITAITNTDATIVAAPERTLAGATGAGPTGAPPVIVAPPAMAALPPEKKSQGIAIALVVGVVVVAIGAVIAWFVVKPMGGDASQVAVAPVKPVPAATGNPGAPAATVAAAPAPAAVPATAAAKADPGTMLISAVGLVDPNDPRYQSDKSLLQADLRADSKSQLVEKALGLLIDNKSLAKNYDLLQAKLLSRSGSFVTTVVKESEPRVGKDGLMSITTQGVVNIKAVQKSLNQMSRDERVEFIRASGDPKVSVRISVRDADQPDAPPQASPVAENILKERIKSFGFRTWSEGAAGADKGPDFEVIGEAKIKRLSMRLEASGLVVTKYTLTSWTVKCVDRETGEEIYFNTALPKGVGSWASEEEALKAIGAKIADEFSRDFFLQHIAGSGKKVTLRVEGLPSSVAEAFARELVGLPDVLSLAPAVPPAPNSYELQLAGSGAATDLVAAGVLKPLNAKLGQACFSLGTTAGDQIAVLFDKACADASILSRFDTNPPAGLYGAPAGRQKTVTRNPQTLQKLTI